MTAMVRRADKLDAAHQSAKRRTRNHTPTSFTSLQFIDDCNAIVRGNVQDMDKALGQAGAEFKLKWDRTGDWGNGVHLGDRNRHQKFREEMSNVAFQVIRRLSRLPKKKMVVSQFMSILTYGAELHNTPSKKGEMYAAEWNRFITGGGGGAAGKDWQI